MRHYRQTFKICVTCGDKALCSLLRWGAGGGGRGGAAGSALGEGVCFRAPEGYRELWLSVFFYRILLNLFLVNFVAF